MKKYVKPELIYESFEMSQQIASCDYDSKGTLMDVSNCGFTGSDGFGGTVTIFNVGNGVCVTQGEGYCEHVASGNLFNIFNS
ncbi:MAG: hypothetical protein IJ325_10535 [Clostridia bacterium]|nr:hypothetical protein [Clostridia bacterium]